MIFVYKVKNTFLVFLSVFFIFDFFIKFSSTVYSTMDSDGKLETTFLGDKISVNKCSNDGYYTFGTKEIINTAIETSGINEKSKESIFICTSQGDIYRIDNPNNNPISTLICSGLSVTYDIAIDKAGNIFTTHASSILSIDKDCNENLYLQSKEVGSNALSFDTNDNLYYGGSNSSSVYRYNAGSQESYEWYDFKSGRSGGDFVIVNGKMYISWITTSGRYKLYEVTYDSDFNYVSHIDLGELPNKTYGLASEYGKLYGVSPLRLFSINIETLETETIIENDDTQNEWYGAAGLHEAVNIFGSAHISKDDAEKGVNSLPDSWTNTVKGKQTIYIRIENKTTGDFEIIEVSLTIFIKPELTKPNDLTICSSNTSNVFDLTQVEDKLLSKASGNFEVSYYNSYDDLEQEVNKLTTSYKSTLATETIYVRVDIPNQSCFSDESFKLKVQNGVDFQLAEITTDVESRILQNCYSNQSGESYFLLDEILSSVILETYDASTTTISYHTSLQDAESSVNEVPNTYIYSNNSSKKELFVRVETGKDCFSVSNFFIDANCLPEENEEDFTLSFPKFFTPNGDTINDSWVVTGIPLEFQNESTVSIFDRYGKLLSTFNPSNKGWDGIYNGVKVLETDYWYVLEIKSINKIYKGHFSVIRR